MMLLNQDKLLEIFGETNNCEGNVNELKNLQSLQEGKNTENLLEFLKAATMRQGSVDENTLIIGEKKKKRKRRRKQKKLKMFAEAIYMKEAFRQMLEQYFK